MRNAHLNIIECGGQHIKPGAILTPDHGIADQPGVKMLLPADEVHLTDGRVMIKPEPPVRTPPLCLNRTLVLIAQRQSAVVLYSRTTPSKQVPWPTDQLLRCFTAGIESPAPPNKTEP